MGCRRRGCGPNHKLVKPSNIHREHGTVPVYFCLDGILDELQVWDRALSAKDIALSAQSHPEKKEPDLPHLVAVSGAGMRRPPCPSARTDSSPKGMREASGPTFWSGQRPRPIPRSRSGFRGARARRYITRPSSCIIGIRLPLRSTSWDKSVAARISGWVSETISKRRIWSSGATSSRPPRSRSSRGNKDVRMTRRARTREGRPDGADVGGTDIQGG